MLDISDTLKAKSDQLNADDLIGGPITIKITSVNKNSTDQPITIHYEGEDGQPFKPCKTVRRILSRAWGRDATIWAGRLMTIYNDPTVKWAGKPIGGIRVSHLSHIDNKLSVSLAVTRGMKKPHVIEPIPTPAQETIEPETPQFKLIKSDGSEMAFPDLQSWLSFMERNLPKIQDISRLETFEISHKDIFKTYIEDGFGVWVEKANEIISENKERLNNEEL